MKKYTVKVIPKSSVSTVEITGPDSLRVKLISAPDKGKANDELIRLLAEEFGVAKSQIEIVSGLTARNKRVRIDC